MGTVGRGRRHGTVPWVVTFVLWGGAVAAIAYAVRHREATAGIFVLFPFVEGSSAALLLGTLLLLGGFVALAFAVGTSDPDEGKEAPPPGSPAPGTRVGSAGFLLLGPVPVVWGAGPPLPRAYWALAAALLGVMVLLTLWTLGLF